MSSLIKILEGDDWVADYDRGRGMYRVSYFEDNHFVDECWFDAYEEKGSSGGFPKCSVGDIVYYLRWDGIIEKCRVSMLQQKSDKSWKVRLTPPDRGVFDITLDEFNERCRFEGQDF